MIIIKRITIFVFILLTGCTNTIDKNIKNCLQIKECSTHLNDKKGYEMVIDKNKAVIASRYNHFSSKGLSNKVAHIMLDVFPRLFRKNYDYYHDQDSGKRFKKSK